MFKKRFAVFVMIAVFLLTAISAYAAVDNVRCILWQGDPAKFHTAISGQSVRLKGVITTTDTSQIWYKWVYGDGEESAVSTLSGNKKYNVSVDYAYTGAEETPFTAILLVDDVDSSMANAVSDTYLVKIQNDNLDSRINIAIDKGLWWLYTNNYANSNFHTFDGSAFMVWNQTSYSNFYASPTASAIQAFAINNHKVTGNFADDPYAEAVRLGLNWLVNGYYYDGRWPMLRALSIGLQPGGNPEEGQTAPNGLGIEVRDYCNNSYWRPIYSGGQIMDAIIASGVIPADDTGRNFTGRSEADGGNWTYGELLQDMCDMYSWGQDDSGSDRGGWRYSWNNDSDNSACQWAAIGMIPAQKAPWNCTVPGWVKTLNENWLNYSHRNYTSWGGFGYDGPGTGYGTSPSGMVQMAFDGQVGYDDPVTPVDDRDAKWVRTEQYFVNNWSGFLSSNNTYGWYAFAKAMRLAVPRPVERLVSNNLDWYKGSGSTKGLAERIVEVQAPSGYWSGNYTNHPLTTAWMVITLRPVLFAAAPIACFDANPNPSYPDMPIMFDPTCSDHSETGKDIGDLVLFEWDWDNDGVYDESTATPEKAYHPFSCASLPCVYPVTLRVTDDEGLTATATRDINITNPPHPPVADAGGPYMVSTCAGDILALDGSGSYDPNEGDHEDGCSTCPDDTITAWDWDLYGAPYDYTDDSGETVTVDPSGLVLGVNHIGLKVTDNTENSFPTSPDGNLTDEDFAEATVYEGCICDLTARAKLDKIQLVWTHTGAASYDIYRSTAGSSGPFELVADDVVTTYATYLDSGLTTGTTYYYRVVTSDGCGSNAASATPAVRTRR